MIQVTPSDLGTTNETRLETYFSNRSPVEWKAETTSPEVKKRSSHFNGRHNCEAEWTVYLLHKRWMGT